MSQTGRNHSAMNPDGREPASSRTERRSLEQVQTLDGLLAAVVRERAGSEADANLANRVLSQMENVPEPMPKRQPSPRLIWLSGLSGLAAAAVVAVLSVHHGPSHSHDPHGGLSGIAHQPVAPFAVDSRIAQPTQRVGAIMPLQRAPVLHTHRAVLPVPQQNDSIPASEEAALPKLETFPAREQTVAEGQPTGTAANVVAAVATEIVVVPAPAWETAELHIQPISMKALPSEKDPQ